MRLSKGFPRHLASALLFSMAVGLGSCHPAGSGRESTTIGQTDIREASDVGEVAQVAQAFLEALSAADTAALNRMLGPGAGIYSVREEENGPSIGAVGREAFLESLGSEERRFLERMWDPTVLVQDGVAAVWAPYDFYLDGAFSHCGVDVFTFLEGGEGWQVASVTYNVVREGCPPSPLGSPLLEGE